MCNFEGKAIYLDADMLVLDDIEELWNEEVAENCGLKCWGPMRTDVSVFDCSWWSSDGRPWMSIKEMKPSGWNCMAYLRRIHQLGGLDHTLDRAWNDCDGHGYGRGENVKLVHYTHALSGQPYRPYDHTYPDEFPYVTTSRKAGLLWWDTYLQALIAQHGEEEGTRIWNEAKA